MSTLMETNKPEQHFIGFDIDDDVLIIIENKKNLAKMELGKETGEPMEVEKPSVLNNNHVNKKKQSKSSISLPEPNEVKNNRSNKRQHLRSDALKSLELQVPPTLELTTPTFNLLTFSNTRTRRSTGRKNNVDIRDAIYKIPFEHGWKRELVYRTSNAFTSRSGDVYYYSPTNQKLRSLREIQEQLDMLSDTDLTIENFTFLKQPIGMNDRSKELIRDANSKLSKGKSFVGLAVKPKKSKTPIQRQPYDFELSDDEKNKSSRKRKIVLKNAKRSSRLRSKKGTSESMNISSSTPEYISEDCQSIQSSASPKISSPELEKIDINNTIVKRRNFEMNDSLREIVTPLPSMQSLNYMVKSLTQVFGYLKTDELLSTSRVCTAWRIIAMNKRLWQKVCLKNSMVYDWERFVDSIRQQKTNTLDTRRMLMPSKVEDFESFWLQFANAMTRAQELKFIELYRCPVFVVEDIIYSLPQIEVLNATSIKNPNLMKETKNPKDLMYLNLNYLGQMTKLTELRLKGLTGIKLTTLPSFENLINLNIFSLTSIKVFPKDIYQSLNTITDNIEFFEIGDCDCLPKDFAVLLKRFVNLKTLRLENCCNEWDQSALDIFTVIRGLEKLNVLELVNIEFNNCVKDELEKCDGIKGLLIIPAYVSQSAATNCLLMKCLGKLSKTLTHLVWGLTHELLRVTDLFIAQYQQNPDAYGHKLDLSSTNEAANNIPILISGMTHQRPVDEATTEKEEDKLNNVNILSVPALEKLLDTMMPDAKIRVIKVPFTGISRVYLTEQFNNF